MLIITLEEYETHHVVIVMLCGCHSVGLPKCNVILYEYKGMGLLLSQQLF
jgi:hypothetical protein